VSHPLVAHDKNYLAISAKKKEKKKERIILLLADEAKFCQLLTLVT